MATMKRTDWHQSASTCTHSTPLVTHHTKKPTCPAPHSHRRSVPRRMHTRLTRWMFLSKLVFRGPLLGLCCYTLPRWMPFFALSIWNIYLIRILTLGRKQRIRVTPTQHLQSLGPPVLTAFALMLVPLAYPDFSGLTIILFHPISLMGGLQVRPWLYSYPPPPL